MEESPYVCLEFDDGPEADFACLKTDGNLLPRARYLRGLLKDGLFRKHRLRGMTPDFRVYINVVIPGAPGLPPPDIPSWKQDTHGTIMDMSAVVALGEYFVILGQFMYLENGYYHPYIPLAGLGPTISMSSLRERGLVNRIRETLRMSIRDPKGFLETQDEFETLKSQLDEPVLAQAG